MILIEATEHMMMKSSSHAKAPFGYRSRRFSSVSLGVFSLLLVDFALRNASETPQKTARGTLEKRLVLLRIPLHTCIEAMTNHGKFHEHYTIMLLGSKARALMGALAQAQDLRGGPKYTGYHYDLNIFFLKFNGRC
jgi:hypothetical protein